MSVIHTPDQTMQKKKKKPNLYSKNTVTFSPCEIIAKMFI